LRILLNPVQTGLLGFLRSCSDWKPSENVIKSDGLVEKREFRLVFTLVSPASVSPPLLSHGVQIVEDEDELLTVLALMKTMFRPFGLPQVKN